MMSSQERRLCGNLIKTYKLITSKVKVDASQFFDQGSNSDTRWHSPKIIQKSKATHQDTVLQSKSGGNLELFTWRDCQGRKHRGV